MKCPFCTNCGGTGIVKRQHEFNGTYAVFSETCPVCRGSGYAKS